MTTFTELELDKSIDDMDGEEAKKTLTQFMEHHEENQSAYDSLQSELDETESEFRQEIEEKEELITEFRQERAEEAAEYVNMPADLLADRFSLDEVEKIIDEAEDAGVDTEFDEDSDGSEPEDDETFTKFSERGEKGQAGNKDGLDSQYRQRATEVLANRNFPTGE